MFMRLLIVSSFLLCGTGLLRTLAGAENEPSANAISQIEPTDFIDNSRPAPSDPASRTVAMPVPTGWGYAVSSPNSELFVTVSVPEGAEAKGEVMFWNVADPKPGVRYEQPGRIGVVAFSPDGKLLALGPHAPQSQVKLIDVATGKVDQAIPGPAARTNAICWSSDGRQLALASTVDKTVRVWNVADKKFVKAHELDVSLLLAVAFTPSGQLLAAGVPLKDRDSLVVFDVATSKVAATLKGHKEQVEAASFLADGTRLASVGWDATVRLWNISTAEEAGEIKGHKKGIRALSVSPDGKKIATASDRECKIWDGEKKEFIADLGTENAGAKSVAVSPDGNWLVSIGRDGTAHLWDLQKQSEKAKLDKTAATTGSEEPDTNGGDRSAVTTAGDVPEPEAIQSLAYSRDGQWIALAREDGRISIRNAADGRVVHELDAFPDVAACVAFSEDSRQLAAGSFDKSIKIWTVASGEQLTEINGHSNWVFAVAFSPDGTTLASGSYDKQVKLWNIAESKEIATLSGHTAGVRSVAFSTDGQKLISGSADRTAIVWDLTSRQAVATLKGHTAAVRAVACSPDGETVATASEDASVKLWRTSDWTERATISGAEGVMFWCLAFSPAGRTLAAGAFDGTVKLYNPVDGKERKTLRGPAEAVTAVAFAPGAREVIAGSIDKSLRRWKADLGATTIDAAKTADPEKVPALKPIEAAAALNAVQFSTEQPVASLVFSRDGSRMAVGTGAYRVAGSLQLWDLAGKKKVWQSDPFRYGLPAVAFTKDEQRLAIGNYADNFVRLMDASNGKLIKEIRGHRAKVTGIAYSPNGRYLATASLDRDIKLWDAQTNKELKTFVGHADYVYSIAFSQDGHRLLSGSADRSARVWDVETGKELLQIRGHQGAIQQAVYSSDGTRIATASADGMVRINDAATGDYLVTLRGHRNRIESVGFSPDGRFIASGSADRTVRIWDPASGAEVLKLTQDAVVRTVLFSPNGKHLAAGCDDKTIKLWEVTALANSEPAPVAEPAASK